MVFLFLNTLKMAGGRPGGTTGNTQVPPTPHFTSTSHRPPKPSDPPQPSSPQWRQTRHGRFTVIDSINTELQGDFGPRNKSVFINSIWQKTVHIGRSVSREAEPPHVHLSSLCHWLLAGGESAYITDWCRLRLRVTGALRTHIHFFYSISTLVSFGHHSPTSLKPQGLPVGLYWSVSCCMQSAADDRIFLSGALKWTNDTHQNTN